MLRLLLSGLALLAVSLLSCKTHERERRTAVEAGREAVPIATSQPLPVVVRSIPAVELCRSMRGPIQLAFTGPVTLWLDAGAPPGSDPHLVFNQDGVPRPVSLPAPKAAKKLAEPSKPERLSLSEPAVQASRPACAVAGASLFCLDKSGGVHRSSLAGQGSAVVAQARPGSSIAAATLGDSRAVYAFLADRRTSEGATTIAFAALDDSAPVTLSEDGAGATFVTLATRGDEITAMYIDARRMLTPVHARVLTAGAKLTIGPDAVIFVGGGTDGRLGGALAQGAAKEELALLSIEKDFGQFGMAAIRVEGRPRDDAKVEWSMFPGAIEHAPIAATQGTWPIRVLRVRPASADASGPKVLEVAEMDAGGVLTSTCVVAEGPAFTDPAIVTDRTGGVWIAYTDQAGTWVEQRGEPLP